MSDKLAMKETFRFAEPGTLTKPGPIGRIVRLSLGVLCIWLVVQLVMHSNTRDLHNPSFWLMAVFSLFLVPYVVNIGLGVNWGAWPRVSSALIVVAAAGYSFVFSGTVLGAPLWATVAAWMTYVFAHLGVSFVLSAILATPGCEMRAIPHVLGTIFRSKTREHYCPGFIEKIDQWELQRKNLSSQSIGDDRSIDENTTKDIVSSAGKQLLVYGIPFAALQLAGNLAGFTIATIVPAIAFLVVGMLCSINAWRSRRVHCYFMGPWCLIAGTMTALYSLRIIDFGPSSWSLFVNTGLAGAAVIYMTTEKIWGKYFV